MSIATVHYLSMNTGDGQITIPAITAGASANLAWASLNASQAYAIIWGDGTANGTFTSNGSGASGNQAHTYARAGAYEVVLRKTDANGPVMGRDTVVAQATLVVPAYTANTPANLSGTLFQNSTAYSIDWGDGTAYTAFTSSGAGAMANTAHTYTTAGSKPIRVLDAAGNVVASGTAVVS